MPPEVAAVKDAIEKPSVRSWGFSLQALPQCLHRQLRPSVGSAVFVDDAPPPL
jgi:hypothetical protein